MCLIQRIAVVKITVPNTIDAVNYCKGAHDDDDMLLEY